MRCLVETNQSGVMLDFESYNHPPPPSWSHSGAAWTAMLTTRYTSFASELAVGKYAINL